MLKDILNLNGVQKLDKQQQKDTVGGDFGPLQPLCSYDNASAAMYGCPVQPNSGSWQQATCHYVCIPPGRWVKQ